jgi:hypothetical protein
MNASPIRNADGKLAITPGVWRLSKTGLHLDAPSFKSAGYCGGACVNSAMRYESSRLADAALIAEAGTVTNQTGRTPAELAALVRELVLAVRMASKYAHGQITYRLLDICDEAESALAKTEGI